MVVCGSTEFFIGLQGNGSLLEVSYSSHSHSMMDWGLFQLAVQPIAGAKVGGCLPQTAVLPLYLLYYITHMLHGLLFRLGFGLTNVFACVCVCVLWGGCVDPCHGGLYTQGPKPTPNLTRIFAMVSCPVAAGDRSSKSNNDAEPGGGILSDGEDTGESRPEPGKDTVTTYRHQVFPLARDRPVPVPLPAGMNHES